MKDNRQIGIDKELRDELLDNIDFKNDLKACLQIHTSESWNKAKNKVSDFSIINGTIKAEYITCIGKITIYQDIKSRDIIVLKSDKIKSHLSDNTDK